MGWIVGVVIASILILLYINYQVKRKEKQLLQSLKEQWGKPIKNKCYNFSLIERYFESHKNEEAFFILSEQTAYDLDFKKLFEFLNRTISKVGEQYLYKTLRVIKSKESLLSLQSLTNLFTNDEKLRLDFQLQLSKLSSSNAYDLEFLTRKNVQRSKKYKRLLYVLLFISVALIIIGVFNPYFFIWLLPVMLINTVFHYQNKNQIQYYLSSITQLPIAYSIAKQFSEKKDVVKYFDISFLKKIQEIINKVTLIGVEKRLDTEMAQLVWFLVEWIKILFNFEVLVFYQLENDLDHRREELTRLFEFIGEIDLAIAVASLRAEDKMTCNPVFVQEKNIKASQIYHPLLENGVANDFNLCEKSLLLTGANMSGKTTFIKTLAVNALLSQTLGFCYAESLQLPFMRIYASIKITDDLLADTSYYLQEVLNVKLFVGASQEGIFSLFILDELFKGTNTIERIAAGRAVLSYLNNEKSIVLVSTHDIELAELLEQESYQLHCFDENIKDGEIRFSYKIKNGTPQEKNAIKILELYNYPTDIILQSNELVHSLEKK